MPRLSVIVPVFGDATFLNPCLESFRASTYRDFELLVADDGSPCRKTIQEACERHGVQWVRLETNQGPGPARNAAARLATGDILVFIDSDETIHPDTLQRMVDALDADPELAAIVGAFDLEPGSTGLVAKFRNLLHAQVHHRSAGEMSTFWAGCGAVRRHWFEALGGFLPHPVEDVEFGIRLCQAGGVIRLDPRIQVKHHKEWTLASMVRTDILVRAAPWTELMMLHGLPKNLNFRWQDRASVAVSSLLPLVLFLAVRHGGLWPCLAGILGGMVMLLQLPLFRFLTERAGPWFAAASYPVYVIHQNCASLGFLTGLSRVVARQDRAFPWVAAAIAVIVFGLVQWGAGAYTVEFDGASDEASHFMNGMLIRDYLVQWPLPDPVAFAEQYYLHYPRISPGQWPPLFHLLEAAWWLFLPPSRMTAMWLVGLLACASAILFYRMARRFVRLEWALFATALLLAAPEFRLAATQVMTEQLNLLLGILFLQALIRFTESGAAHGSALMACFGGLSILVKGSALTLLPAPLLSLTFSGQLRQSWKARSQGWWPILALLGIAAGSVIFYLVGGKSLSTVLQWAGIGWRVPWTIQPLVNVAGAGLCLMAIAGFALPQRSDPHRQAVRVACGSLLVSILAVAYVVRAMRENRHFIVALPAFLILGLLLVLWLSESLPVRLRRSGAAVALTVMLAWFPWMPERLHREGMVALASQLHLPARILVSAANGTREGAWPATIAQSESPRPQSVVARSTRTIASEGFNGERYRLLLDSPAEILRFLDRHHLDTVILDDLPSVKASPPRHHELVRRAVSASPQWTSCARDGKVEAFCRTANPSGFQSAEPLRIHFPGTRRTIVETVVPGPLAPVRTPISAPVGSVAR